MSLWNQLSAERRKHVRLGLLGVSISWSVAALMAFAGPASNSQNPHRVSEARDLVKPLNIMLAGGDASVGRSSTTLSLAPGKIEAAMIKGGADIR